MSWRRNTARATRRPVRRLTSRVEPQHKDKGAALVNALSVGMMVLGVGIFLYPTVANWYNTVNASQTIQGYNREVEQKTQQERQRMWAAAESYNAELAEQVAALGGTLNTALMPEDLEARYGDTLAVDLEGLMGTISIPSIGVNLPIGHGTSEKVLQMGIGHYEASSLPVGGASTHCVLTGHTGLPSARLFTDLDKLEVGDIFQLNVLGQTLTYEVFSIQVVLPTDVDALRIEEGEDLCTLLTCTPYGINSHRLLVTGRRVANPEEGEVAVESAPIDEGFVRFLFLLPVLGAGAAGLHYLHKRKGRNSARHLKSGKK